MLPDGSFMPRKNLRVTRILFLTTEKCNLFASKWSSFQLTFARSLSFSMKPASCARVTSSTFRTSLARADSRFSRALALSTACKDHVQGSECCGSEQSCSRKSPHSSAAHTRILWGSQSSFMFAFIQWPSSIAYSFPSTLQHDNNLLPVQCQFLLTTTLFLLQLLIRHQTSKLQGQVEDHLVAFETWISCLLLKESHWGHSCNNRCGDKAYNPQHCSS